MDRERTTDQILRVQFALGAKGIATGGSRGARRPPGASKDGAQRAGYTRGMNTRARDILLFADDDKELKQPKTRSKGSLPLVTFLNPNEVVSVPNIDFGDNLGFGYPG